MSSPKHHADLLPDLNRCIYLNHPIDQALVTRLTPEILKLQAQSRQPITVFIDSPGGSVVHAGTIAQLLASKGHDGELACRITTVATGLAASAAADLLMAGSYALVYPHARILCHGGRQGADALTREDAEYLAKYLAQSNEQIALHLASNCIARFIFRLVSVRSSFAAMRQPTENAQLTDVQCFIRSLEDKLSSPLNKLLADAQQRSAANDALDRYASDLLQSEPHIDQLRPAAFEALMLKAILDYEVQADPAGSWTFSQQGFSQLEDKLTLLLDRYAPRHQQMISSLCDRWGSFFLEEDKIATLRAQAEDGKVEWLRAAVNEKLRPIWFFFVSICRLLQRKDYWLSAEEAY